MTPLTCLYYSVTRGCSLACAHCWVDSTSRRGGFRTWPRDREELTPAEFGDLLDQALGLGLESVKFTGGEPLIRSDFPDLYYEAARRGLSTYVETSGTVVPDGLADLWRSHPPDHVSLSLDSWRKEEHDRFRGRQGAFERTLSFAGMLRDLSVPFQVISMLLGTDGIWLDSVASRAESLGASSLKFNSLGPLGRAAGLRSRAYSVQEVKATIQLNAWIERRYSRSVHFSIPPAFIAAGRLPFAGSCSVTTNLGLLPDGRASPCGVGLIEPSLVAGDARSEGLDAVWSGSTLLRSIRETVPDRLRGICSRCLLRNACMGYCLAENYCLTGRLDSPSPFCAVADEAGLFPPTRLVPR
ncbi:radical SAM protein [Candidatus Fermentibacterales bacterium]|nr:radical SAM protein [Candidatus Fermentibacterales bacterium]